MLTYAELRAMSDARVEDAKALWAAGRWDGAFYIVGYAIEYRLKGRIATSLLKVGMFPRYAAEFDRLAKIKSHRLDELLKLSGRGGKVIEGTPIGDAWEYLQMNWSTESRYAPIGTATPGEADAMIRAVELLLRVL